MTTSKATRIEELTFDDLVFGPRAYFYRAPSTISVATLHNLAARVGGGAVALEKTVVVRKAEVHFAALVREYNVEPSFVDGTLIRETRCGMVLLACVGDLLAVQTVGAGRWNDGKISTVATRFDPDVVGTVLSEGGTFQKVKMRSMNIARSAIRARTFEASSLDSSMSPQGMNRQIPESARVRKSDCVVSATPTTSRLAEVGQRLGVEAFAHWLVKYRAKFRKASRKPAPGEFLLRFAQPIRMETLVGRKIRPTAVLLGLEWLVEGLSSGEMILERGRADRVQPINAKEVARIVGALSEPGLVDVDGEVTFTGLEELSAHLERGRQAFKLSGSFDSPVYVRELNDDGAREPLLNRAHREESMSIVFSDLRYAYALGRLFMDRNLKTQVSTIRQVLRPVAELKTCSSEKGKSTSTATRFSSSSIFRVIETKVALKSERALVCDDMGDEWADYIGIGSAAADASISLYHAKHKEGSSTGASGLHDVVSQALKNVGRTSAAESELRSVKLPRWRQNWSNLGTTKIARVRRGGTAKNVVDSYLDAMANPRCRGRVCLVLSFLSKAEVEVVLSTIERSSEDAHAALKPYQAQLVHLLVAFVAGVREANAEPVVYCAP